MILIILYWNILIYDVLYKKLISGKPLCVMCDKVDGFVRDYNRSKYLALFGSEKNNINFNRITFLIGLKTNISYVVSHNYANIKIDSDDDLHLEKNIHYV